MSVRESFDSITGRDLRAILQVSGNALALGFRRPKLPLCRSRRRLRLPTPADVDAPPPTRDLSERSGHQGNRSTVIRLDGAVEILVQLRAGCHRRWGRNALSQHDLVRSLVSRCAIFGGGAHRAGRYGTAKTISRRAINCRSRRVVFGQQYSMLDYIARARR